MNGRTLLLACALSALGAGPAQAWQIADFDVRVELREDATARVTETIVADFMEESRHGIYRDIPVDYVDRFGQRVRLRLRVADVTDERGTPRRYRMEPAGRYQRVRIGDPDVTVTGVHTYRIVYEVVRGAVRFFPDHDECYWNLTGNEWAVPMRHVRAVLSLPSGFQDLRVVAYVGGYGSTEMLTSARVTVQGSEVALEPARGFGPYEGLTVAVGWAKGAVQPPGTARFLAWWLEDNWVYGLPLALFMVMWVWWDRRGREPDTRRSRVVQYGPPDGLTPAEAGTLIDQHVHVRDITATVIDLAVHGYLRIEPRSKTTLGFKAIDDYRLVKTTPATPRALKPHEQAILKGLFGTSGTEVELSSLREAFYQHLGEIRQALYGELVRARYFDADPQDVRTKYFALAAAVVGVMSGGLFLTKPLHGIPETPIVVSSLATAAIMWVFALAMPRRTLRGAHAADQLTGFVEFLERADRDRLRRTNDPNMFERCLPYALAFGVAHQWARAFQGLYVPPPAWYSGGWDDFSAGDLTRDLDRATTSMSQAFTSSPRSSDSSGFGGGGFSGGGGGGGGGGAW